MTSAQLVGLLRDAGLEVLAVLDRAAHATAMRPLGSVLSRRVR